MKSWLSIAVTVAAVDGWMLYRGRDTLSAEYRTLAHVHPVPMAAATGYVVAHLWGWLPKKYDVFYGFACVSQIPLRKGEITRSTRGIT